MENKNKIESHRLRLFEMYEGRNLSPKIIEETIGFKLNRLDPTLGSENYKKWMIKFLEAMVPKPNAETRILDFGCGTGEFVALINSLGYQCDGTDIFTEELKIAEQLLTDHGFKSSSVIHANLVDYSKYDSIILLSVLEHLSDDVFIDVLRRLSSVDITKIFILVPNKYKILDDHTRLPLVGLLPRWLMPTILKVTNKKYELSVDKEWDVWYRSPSEIEKLCIENNFIIEYLPDDLVYPPLDVSKKLNDIQPRTLVSKFVLFLYRNIYMNFVAKHQYNSYPYLNILLTKKK